MLERLPASFSTPRRLSSERTADDTVSGRLPRFACSPHHRRFTGAGPPDDCGHPPCFDNMRQRRALLRRQRHMTRMVSLLFAGIKLSSCNGRLDAKVADPRGIFRAGNRTVFDWNRGRLQIGTVAGF